MSRSWQVQSHLDVYLDPLSRICLNTVIKPTRFLLVSFQTGRWSIKHNQPWHHDGECDWRASTQEPSRVVPATCRVSEKAKRDSELYLLNRLLRSDVCNNTSSENSTPLAFFIASAL